MAVLTMEWTGNGIARISHALKNVEGKRAHTVLRRAINHTGRKTFTAVKRAVAKQAGLTQAATVAKGRLRTRAANFSSLDFLILSSGQHISLKEFKPRQNAVGTAASPWGDREMFEHAFRGPRPGAIASALGGHVFVREGSRRTPIRKLWGPAIPKEIVKNESAAAFFATVNGSLPPRVEHELKGLTNGAFS